MLLKKSLNLMKKKGSDLKSKPLIDEEKKSHKNIIVPSFRKIKQTMGNLTSSKFYLGQHYIENDEEHAVNMMNQLCSMRQQGTHCDLTINRENGGKFQAHKLVVGFNPSLLEMAQSSKAASSVDKPEFTIGQEATEQQETQPEDQTSYSDENSLIKELNVKEMKTLTKSQFSFENKGFEHTDGDVIDEEQTNKTGEENKTFLGVAADGNEATEDADEKPENEKASISEDEKDASEDETVKPDDDGKPTESNSLEEHEDESDSEDVKDENLSTPLVNELQLEAEDKKEATTIDLNDLSDGTVTPISLSDPVEILVNYLYTSKIDITKKNVGRLHVLAKQCALNEVVTACDEFDNVLRIETENMPTSDEKDQAASQFRYQFSDVEHFAKMMAHFNSMRSQSKLTDVTITHPLSPTTRLPAHSILLEACSPSFFESKVGFCEASAMEQSLAVEVSEVNNHVIKGMVEYIYTGKVGVSTGNVKQLMEAGKVLEIPAIIDGSAEFLKGIITSHNDIEYLRLAKEYTCKELEKFIIDYMEENFKHSVKSPSFLTMTSDELVSFLKPNHIAMDFPVAHGEQLVFKAVQSWVNHDPISRKSELIKVMNCVRFELISESHLVEDVTTDMLVMENDQLCQKVARIITCKQHNAFDDEVAMRGKPVVLLVGGSSPIDDVTSEDLGYTEFGYSKSIYLFNVGTGSQHEIAQMPETRSLHCSVVRDQFLYVIGGFDNFSCMTNTVYCLDFSTGKWHSIPTMKSKRVCFTAFANQEFIYVFGGLTPSGYTATVERYSRLEGKWRQCAPMPSTSYRHAGCFYGGEYYISGGYEKEDRVFAYNPTKNEWRKVVPLNYGRDSHSMCDVSGRLYVIGGDGASLPIEYYDRDTKKWTVVRPMTPGIGGKLYLPGVTVIDQKIYLFGGWWGEDDVTADIMCLDTSRDEWQHIRHHLSIPRGSLSANTINVPASYFHAKFPNP